MIPAILPSADWPFNGGETTGIAVFLILCVIVLAVLAVLDVLRRRGH